MTGFAIAGLGNIGKVHLSNLRSLRGSKVTGVFDPFLQELPADFRAYGSLDELVSDVSVDAVVVATPSDRHAEIVIAALAAGKHVFVEKPLAGTLADAERIVQAAQNHSDRIVQAGFCERSNLHYLEAHRAVVEGKLGEIRAIQTSRVAPYAVSNEAWELGVLDTAVHNLDLILWLKQQAPVSVRAEGVKVYEGSRIPHSVTTTLRFADGAMAVDQIAWLRDEGYPLNQCARSRMFIQGSEGFFDLDLTDRPAAIGSGRGYRKIDTVILGAAEYAGCLKLQFEYFLNSIESGAPVQSPLEDALLAERVVLAAQESLRTGSEVRIGG